MSEILHENPFRRIFNRLDNSSDENSEKDEADLLDHEIARLEKEPYITSLKVASDILKEDDPLASVKRRDMGGKDDIRNMVLRIETENPEITFKAMVAVLSRLYTDDQEIIKEWNRSALNVKSIEEGIFTIIKMPLIEGLGLELNTMSGRSCLSLVEPRQPTSPQVYP